MLINHISDKNIIGYKSNTFMNLSEKFVTKTLEQIRINLEDPKVFIVCDCLEIPLGKWRFKSLGSH